ncbi:MAG: hypothetical protein K8Q89_10215 [Nitrosarchaeum sp.]|nr:hypothetical protein [Nitrosarchaeum sp.]
MRFTGFFIALGGVAFWIAIPEYWEGFKKMLNEIHPAIIPIGLVSVMIIGAIVFVYDYRTRKNGSVSNKEVCKKIHGELKDGIESLDGHLDRKTQEHEINGKKVHYKHIYMNHRVYDGYVNSGNFNEIHHTLQQPIQDVYHKITIHDQLVQKIVDNDYVDDDVITLNQIEIEMIKEIPSVMESLKKYF